MTNLNRKEDRSIVCGKLPEAITTTAQTIVRRAMSRARTEQEILKDLQRVEFELSPENLHCDGEISRSRAAQKARTLTARRRRLVSELGREPSFAEIWDR